ncbi:MAG TPA: hypothetical protein VF171_04320, partial [Trueperaceae bacterium]
NDDAIRSIQLVTSRLSDLIVEVRGGVDVEPEVAAAEEAQRETLPTPVSSPERTIAMAAKAAQDEAAAKEEAAPAAEGEAAPDKEAEGA